nr:immunoglobulin light chain junction region [Macaca mulatta]
TVYSIIYPLTF